MESTAVLGLIFEIYSNYKTTKAIFKTKQKVKGQVMKVKSLAVNILIYF